MVKSVSTTSSMSRQSKKISSRSVSVVTISAVASPPYPDFDELFENPSKFRPLVQYESVDEGVYSFDIESPGTGESENEFTVVSDTSPDKQINRARGKLVRTDSIMQLTLTQMLKKNYQVSKGFRGFKRRTANHVSHKYCSYFRVDDMIFIFMYIVFGIIYVCAGTLGLVNCSGERAVNLFLIGDGLLSVLVFPITIMEWTKHIGGCLNETEKVGSPVCFIIVSFLRLSAAIAGSVIFSMRVGEIPESNAMCFGVLTLLKVGVVLEWAFVLFAIICPYSLYIGAFCWARSKVCKK